MPYIPVGIAGPMFFVLQTQGTFSGLNFTFRVGKDTAAFEPFRRNPTRLQMKLLGMKWERKLKFCAALRFMYTSVHRENSVWRTASKIEADEYIYPFVLTIANIMFRNKPNLIVFNQIVNFISPMNNFNEIER